MSSAAGTVTVLFTDLVNSAELLQRGDDERAQRTLRAHYKLLRSAGAAHGEPKVKWLGDGLLALFVSPADAVRCAVALQQAARRRPAGERLSVRVGLHLGEAPREETDYFGAPVVIARRLCGRAQGGQILCSGLVAGLLVGRQTFAFRDCGLLELTGVAAPAAANEVLYRDDDPTALLVHTPFVGRAAELAKLTHRLQVARAGQGGVMLLAGEPGIGKTRLIEEFSQTASEVGARVLAGRCYEGEWAPPYGPFVEAIGAYARDADPEHLRQELGLGAPPIARLVGAIRERMSDIPDAVALQPDEERFRLFDAVSQFLIAIAGRTPVLLIVDDLQWADTGSIAMLRHVARFAPRHRLLILAAYRDVEVEPGHPLGGVLGALPRETRYEHLPLKGLDGADVKDLLETIADQTVPDAMAASLSAETGGNPFFIRELLLHLIEEKKIFQREGQSVSRLTMAEIGIPEGVRQVIRRRLGRLSADAQNLLMVAAAFTGCVPLTIAGRVAGLAESATLNAVDEALAAQLVRPGSTPETCDFAHALIRQTLYAALSPARQLRLHRQIAETMEETYGPRAVEHAAAIADQYHRSASLPGAERGVQHAIIAADRVAAAYAHDEVATYLRMAQTLLPEHDARRPRLVSRLAIALAWALDFEAALSAAQDAATRIAAAEGEPAAADYLADAAVALDHAGSKQGAWALAMHGLRLTGDRHDKTWVRLMSFDIVRREAEDPDYPGLVPDTPERRALADEARSLSIAPTELGTLRTSPGNRFPTSRQELLAGLGNDPSFDLLFGGGEYRRAGSFFEQRALQFERQGRISSAQWGHLARARVALGELAAARQAYDRGAAQAARSMGLDWGLMDLAAARYDLLIAVDEGWEDFLRATEAVLQRSPVEYKFLSAAVQATGARVYARLGRADEALALIGKILIALQRTPAWGVGYAQTACDAAAALWLLDRGDQASVIERALRNVVAIDFRYPMRDARLGLAHLCALQDRYEEAVEWFAQARRVLEEQEARPLRAIVDYDEALMYERRGAAGDRERAAPLLAAALEQFRAIGMTGWIKRAEEFARGDQIPAESSEHKSNNLQVVDGEPEITDQVLPGSLFRKEGDYWTIAFDGRVIRLKDSKGLQYLAQLLRNSGHELHVLDLMAGEGVGSEPKRRRGGSGRVPLLDAQAKAAYKRRLDELRDELAEAQANSDIGRAAKARDEIEVIGEQLAAAAGLGGRDRPGGADAERARLAVTKGIKAALQKIRASDSTLGRHFANSVKTGYFCSYAPDPQRPVTWTL